MWKRLTTPNLPIPNLIVTNSKKGSYCWNNCYWPCQCMATPPRIDDNLRNRTATSPPNRSSMYNTLPRLCRGCCIIVGYCSCSCWWQNGALETVKRWHIALNIGKNEATMCSSFRRSVGRMLHPRKKEASVQWCNERDEILAAVSWFPGQSQ